MGNGFDVPESPSPYRLGACSVGPIHDNVPPYRRCICKAGNVRVAVRRDVPRLLALAWYDTNDDSSLFCLQTAESRLPGKSMIFRSFFALEKF